MVDYLETVDLGRPKAAFPAYLNHSPSGQARAVWNGQTIYLGRYGSPESREAYRRLLAEIAAYGRPVAKAEGITVADLVERFSTWSRAYYGPDSGEPLAYRYATDEAVRIYGSIPASDFGPARLKTVRSALETAGRVSRKTVNRRIRQLVRVFAWGVESGFVDPGTWQALTAVRSLSIGRTVAADYDPIEPVGDNAVAAALFVMPSAASRLVRFQYHTGCRPGEALAFDIRETDRTEPVWVYRPRAHKTRIHGIRREVFIGPRAQDVVADLPGDKPLAAYSAVDAYRRAVERSCRRAGIPVWTPNQLRHAAATRIRSAYGLETAQAILGHTSADMTTRYAQTTRELATAAAMRSG